MIIDLTYSVTFPTTGKSLTHSIVFEPGLTALVGANGNGKSFTGIEMPRWLLFGVQALRAEKAQYSNLSGRMTFRVRDQIYVVERSPSREALTEQSGKLLAVGPDAVNKAVVGLFGYGLDVFDMANACLQGEVKALTSMKATERKAMIDRLIGLDSLEALEKTCRSEAKTLARNAEALSATLPPAPIEPVRPQDYLDPATLERAIADLLAVQSERQKLEAVVAALGVPSSAPILVTTASIEELEQHQAEFEALRQRRLALPAAPARLWSLDEIEAVEAWHAYEAEVTKRGLRPERSLDEIEAAEAAWLARDSWAPMVPCENCGYGANHPAQPPAPAWSKAQLQQERLRLDRWAAPLEEPSPHRIALFDPAAARAALASQDLRREIDSLPVLLDRSEELRLARKQEVDQQVYLQLAADYARRSVAAKAAQAALEAGADVSDALAQARQQLVESRAYDAAEVAYVSALATFDRVAGAIAEHQKKAEGFAAGGNALKEVRLEFKTHLVPAVASVASKLLAAMTGGAFHSVEITPEFEVSVCGQPVRTMSGSEAAVANLALRIALGQTITNRVFSVFLGDEIDAEMDASRTEHTSQAIRGLSSMMGQIVLITHKEIEADTTITV